MQIKCEYCGSFIDDAATSCPNCGAVNENLKRSASGTPQTIEELAIWYKNRNLPPYEVTRFFIGIDYKEPKAFGIYKEGKEYIVYKNKADGSRAIRYRGEDQAYAVNELYLRLKSEILNQKAHNANSGNYPSGDSKKPGLLSLIKKAGIVCFIVFALTGFILSLVDDIKDEPYKRHYYGYNNDVYYCESYVNDEWYIYDYSRNDYLPVSLPSEIYNNILDYKYADDEVWDSGIVQFEDTDTGKYVETQRASSNSDSDYDWDSSDSWSSDSSDWDSDW